MHVLRSLVNSKKYGLLREIDVSILGNAGGAAAPIPHSWLHQIDAGGGVRSISGPHAMEFALALAGPGRRSFSKIWTEIARRRDAGGELRECSADDNALIISEHDDGAISVIRLGTTSRKAEEIWTARCDEATVRYSAEKKLIIIENFGKFTELATDRSTVLNDYDLNDSVNLLKCSERSFPALVLLKVFVKKIAGEIVDLPDLNILGRCVSLLSVTQ